jgi:serine/threonine protein kinase
MQNLCRESLMHFRILREIGRGGMGEVYVAQDVKLHRLVALKLLPAAFQQDPERARWFERETAAAVVEASLLARLQEGNALELGRKKPPVLRDLAERFLE